MPGASRCLVVPKPRPDAVRRLVVFPHAGGAASFYRGWQTLLPSDVELQIVQYPGRENRFTDPLASSVTELAEEAADALGEPAHRRHGTTLFGHSMGAAVAYETELALENRGVSGLTGLFVSARAAPGSRPATRPPTTDAEILHSVRTFGGTPAELLDEPQYRVILTRLLRHDYRLIGDYRRETPPRVRVPVTALWSRDDPTVPGELVDGWSDCTTGRFRREVFDGGHFYLTRHTERVTALLVAAASPSRPVDRAPG